MNTVITIAKKELASYFNSAIAYIFFTLFLTILSFLFFRVYFLVGRVSVTQFFSFIPWVFLIFIPAITMKSWAEEKKTGTLEVLLSMPLTDTQLVIGKALSSTLFTFIALALSLIVPLLVSLTGNLDWGPVWSSYFGAALLAASYVAIGSFVSSTTKNQVSAFLITSVIILVFLLIGIEPVYSIFPTYMAEFIKGLSLNFHFQSLGRGVVDSRDVIYYLSIIGIFLFANVKSLESRN